MSVYDELKALIDYVQSVYDEITNIWQEQAICKINLKKSQVKDIDIDGKIYSTINEYVKLLNKQSSIVFIQLPSICSSQVTARVKAQNSIELKIQNYKTAKHEFGKVSINKCFNDLFGVRIILKNPLSYDEITAFIKQTYDDKYKCIDSSKLEYKATHLYFKQGNTNFQWELQIWNECDRENNLKSHKKYKQEYTTWEKESKEGGIVND